MRKLFKYIVLLYLYHNHFHYYSYYYYSNHCYCCDFNIESGIFPGERKTRQKRTNCCLTTPQFQQLPTHQQQQLTHQQKLTQQQTLDTSTHQHPAQDLLWRIPFVGLSRGPAPTKAAWRLSLKRARTASANVSKPLCLSFDSRYAQFVFLILLALNFQVFMNNF